MVISRLGHRKKGDSEFTFGQSQTVPDQALTVRDIITRFRCGTMEIPPYETGEPDDIDDPLSHYDDLVDAFDDFERGVSAYRDMQSHESPKSSESSDSPESSDTVLDDA